MISGSIRTGAVSLTVAAVVAASLAPLGAQEDRDSVYAALFHSLGLQERVAEPEPKIAPRLPARLYSPRALDHRFQGRPPQTVREKRELKKIETAKPADVERPNPADIPANPHLALMTDPTLVPGDIVIFPDGPRVFQGEPGKRHAATDFVPFGEAKGLSKADRKYLTALRTGVNEAWAEESADRKMARNTRDVERTGSVSKKRNRR
jgi:hypothetical protein